MKPKLTWAIPVYNKQAWLGECLLSIEMQDLKDFEVIMYNDGSTDNSLEIMDWYSKYDSRYKLFSSSENKGISFARNFITSQANADIIVIADADDYHSSTRAKHTWNGMKNGKVDVLYGSFLKSYYDLRPYETKDAPKFDIEQLKKPGGQFVSHGFTAVRKDAMEAVPYRADMKYGIDHAFFLDLALKGYRFVPSVHKMGVYRQLKDGVSVEHRETIVKQDLEMCKQYELITDQDKR